NPDSEAARIAHAAAAGVGSSMVPGASLPMLARNAVSTGIAGAVGQGASDAGLSPAWATALSMAPQAAGQVPAMAVRGVIRGGSTGAQQMQDRIDTLNAAGISSPPVGLAAG